MSFSEPIVIMDHGIDDNDIIPAPTGFIEKCQSYGFNAFTHWYTGEPNSAFGYYVAPFAWWKRTIPVAMLGEQIHNGYVFKCTCYGGIGGGCGQECEIIIENGFTHATNVTKSKQWRH